MTTLKDVFKKFVKDPIPPKYVFCMVKQEIKTIPLSELDSYDDEYSILNKNYHKYFLSFK